jgi:hypothetical protein
MAKTEVWKSAKSSTKKANRDVEDCILPLCKTRID